MIQEEKELKKKPKKIWENLEIYDSNFEFLSKLALALRKFARQTTKSREFDSKQFLESC